MALAVANMTLMMVINIKDMSGLMFRILGPWLWLIF
jgi:hypothetical protein